MITEALVGTWFALCAAMLYSDPRLWIVFASSLAFTAVRVTAVPRVTRYIHAYNTLSPSSRLLFANTLVSLVHSLLASLLALVALACDQSLTGDFVNRASRTEFVTTAVSTGYFAYDLWDFVLHKLYVKAPGIVVHHVVILICYVAALTKTVGVPLLTLALVCELHSASMHVRKLVTISRGRTKKSQLLSNGLRVVWFVQWVTFVAARVVPHGVVTFLTVVGYTRFEQPVHFWIALSGMVFINILNLQLLRDVTRAFRNDCRLNQPTQETNDADAMPHKQL